MRAQWWTGVISMVLLGGCPDAEAESDAVGSGATTGEGTGTTGVAGSSGAVASTSGQEGSGSSGDAQSSSSDGGIDSTTSGADSTTGMGGGSTDSTTGGSMESSSGGEPQNLLDNPSLETWTSAEVPNTTPDLWVNCSTGGIGVDAVPDSCVANPVGPVDGLRYARAVGGEGIEQTIDTVAGTTYEISFSYCGVAMCFGSAPNSAWDVVIDGMIVDTTPAGMGTVWSGHSLEFVATAATTTLCFRRSDSVGQGGIDDLAVFEQ